MKPPMVLHYTSNMIFCRPSVTVLQHIKQQQIKWFGHITHMPINQPALWAYNAKHSGWREPEEDQENEGATPWQTPSELKGCPFSRPPALLLTDSCISPWCLPVQAEERSKVKWDRVQAKLKTVPINFWEREKTRDKMQELNTAKYPVMSCEGIQAGHVTCMNSWCKNWHQGFFLLWRCTYCKLMS